ncbi:MAG TPA: M13 family metallopeptidase [Allosphingosinicella sp.]|jgi:putative endopeptidase
MKNLKILAASAAALAIAAASVPAPLAAQAKQAAAPLKFGSWGVDLGARDLSVKPGDSFFDHANGGWYKATQIPADQPIAGVAMDTHLLTQAQLRSVVEDSARNPSTRSARQVGAVYASFMDEARVEALDASPLAADLAAVKAAASKSDMARIMGATTGTFGTSVFSFGISPDPKGTNLYMTGINIGGLGLPDRDYYLTDQFKAQREAYAGHVERTLQLIGWADPAAAAKSVLAFETGIAEATWSQVEQRDPVKMYKQMTLSALRAHAPEFDWAAFFAGVGAPPAEQLIVSQDSAVPNVARIFAEAPLDTLKAWEAFHIANEAAPYLSKRFVDNRFAFIRSISGQQQNRPRWERGVNLVNGVLGEVLGQEYVARHFPASSKAKMEEMVRNLHAAMKARIEGAAWMTPQTRAAALDKLAKQRVKVGYPNKWRDYSGLELRPDDLYGNVKRASAFTIRYYFDRIGKPVDRDEWMMTPQTINAYFNPLGNEIVFPAAMLQAPMFDPKADPAVNYGAIGAVIGHEISHGFDDQGRQFDEAGRLRDWWQPQDSERFVREAGKLAEQYGAYEGAPGMKVNGKLTLGENIGDQGGVRIALDAYHASLKGRKPPMLDGLSGDQRFFLAWAQGWRGKVRDELMRMILVSDPHSPYRWRVDGTLRNIDEFYSAFGVKPGDKLYLAPKDRVRVW